MPSRHWLKDFLHRNKKAIKMIKEKRLQKNRRDGFTEEMRSGWFSNLKNILINNDLQHKAMQRRGRISKQNRPILFSLFEYIRKCTEPSKKMC